MVLIQYKYELVDSYVGLDRNLRTRRTRRTKRTRRTRRTRRTKITQIVDDLYYLTQLTLEMGIAYCKRLCGIEKWMMNERIGLFRKIKNIVFLLYDRFFWTDYLTARAGWLNDRSLKKLTIIRKTNEFKFLLNYGKN